MAAERTAGVGAVGDDVLPLQVGEDTLDEALDEDVFVLDDAQLEDVVPFSGLSHFILLTPLAVSGTS